MKDTRKAFLWITDILEKNNISEELRTGSDGYTDLLSIEEIWGKDLKHRT